MTIEADIVNELLADPTVTAIVGQRVYVGTVFDVTYPMVQVRGSGGRLSRVLTGEGSQQNREFQFDCYDVSEANASTLAKAVRDALTGDKSAFTGVGVDQPQSLYDNDTKAHRQSFDMSIWFY